MRTRVYAKKYNCTIVVTFTYVTYACDGVCEPPRPAATDWVLNKYVESPFPGPNAVRPGGGHLLALCKVVDRLSFYSFFFSPFQGFLPFLLLDASVSETAGLSPPNYFVYNMRSEPCLVLFCLVSGWEPSGRLRKEWNGKREEGRQKEDKMIGR